MKGYTLFDFIITMAIVITLYVMILNVAELVSTPSNVPEKTRVFNEPTSNGR